MFSVKVSQSRRSASCGLANVSVCGEPGRRSKSEERYGVKGKGDGQPFATSMGAKRKGGTVRKMGIAVSVKCLIVFGDIICDNIASSKLAMLER